MTTLSSSPQTVVEVGEHSLMLDGEAFRSYVELEVARLKRKDAEGNDRPLGLRLSTHCPIRRVKEFFEPTRYRIPIDPGVAERGHEMESRFYACCPGLVKERQAVIQWDLGTSAFDGIGPDDIPLELKSSVKHRTPQSAHKAQAARMLTVTDRRELVFYILDPSSLTARGPFGYSLSEDTRVSVKAELAGCQTALDVLAKQDRAAAAPYWDDHGWWAEHNLSCSCGACLRHDAVDADQATEKLGSAYALAKTQAEATSRACDEARENLVQAAQLRLQALEQSHGRVRTYWTPLSISISQKTGRATIRRINE